MENLNAYFTVSTDLISTSEVLDYDLYVNSSARPSHERFVKVFKSGRVLEESELNNFNEKYAHLYVREDQRNLVCKSMVFSSRISDKRKVEVLKDAAIGHLEKIFNQKKKLSTALLEQTITNCKESVEHMIHVVKGYKIDMLQKLISDLSYHDFYTFDHSVNVCLYSISTLKAIKPNASMEQLVTIGLGGLLHDIGKINIPTTIINNPGALTDEQYAVMKKHPRVGRDMVLEHKCSCEGVSLDAIAAIMYQHHENYNGTGYPNKLKAKDISVYARIVTIADFFDALTTQRSYHKVLSTKDALKVMYQSVEKKIDPLLFNAFAGNALHAEELKEIQSKFLSLPDGFDPGKPHSVLPFENVDTQVIERVFNSNS